ncbi:HypF finger family [Sulfurihydrogenibium azorense Az-Fu1]|uniref:HypF finger family n=1 Tax=Sulfurihydrogenibium azorense (strain DSM 15241 / OCM 825 / Az-Fu1) TaxID=204536 RepID=C1DUF6_SULAA|nr:acylphosphatase [Sulfurihydrogenibium azorense]ACN99229.1 HypF finger family [Sulfurihydrogenibium azorense Az-Fu1]
MDEITLEIKIPYPHQNDIFLPLIKRIGEKEGIKGYVERTLEGIKIVISSNEDKVKTFMEVLGSKLPVSFFMSDASVEISEEEITNEDFFIKNETLNILPVNYGLCPSCTQELLNPNSKRYLYPFISCSFCGFQYSYLFYYPFDRKNTIFKYFQMCDNCQQEYDSKFSFRYKYPLTSCYECFIPVSFYEDNEEVLSLNPQSNLNILLKVAEYIENGKDILLKTLNGYKSISKHFQPNSYILITNPEKISDIAYLSNKEVRLLASIEKPSVKLQLKEEFSKKENINLNFWYLKFPDDPLIVSLSNFLKKKGIDYVFVNDESHSHENCRIDFDIKIENPQKELKVAIVQGKTLVLEGEKGLFPCILKIDKDVEKTVKYKGLGCTKVGKNEYLIDKVDKIQNLEEKDEIKGLDKYDPYKLAIMSVIAEHNLFDEKAVCIYLSKRFESVIAVKKTDIKPLIKVLPLRSSENEDLTVSLVLSEISNLLPEYDRLVKRYAEKFKINLEKNYLNEYLELSYGLEPIFNIIGKILNIGNLDTIESNALDFKISRGLMVDFVIREDKGSFYIDWQKALASLMSYRLAGDNEKIISFSMIESFSEFIENQVSKISTKFNTNNVVITGDFLSNTVLTGRILKHLSRYNVFTNTLLPVSHENFVLGGMFID